MNDELRAIKAWRAAAQALGIEVIAPFEFIRSGRRHTCVALLPHFGGSSGIVLKATGPPLFETDEQFKLDATASGRAWSFINVDLYRRFDREAFVEALQDWGYTGPPDQRPSWLDEP